MNFFKELSRVADRINEWGNKTHQPNWTGQSDPLTDLIKSCSYANKSDLGDAVTSTRCKSRFGRCYRLIAAINSTRLSTVGL